MQRTAHAIAAGTLLLSAIATLGCVKEISSDERLERSSPPDRSSPAPSAEELARSTCASGPERLARARGENRPEEDRLRAYEELYRWLKERNDLFEEALSRNPDLAYSAQAEQISAAHEQCTSQLVDVRVEFDRFVRDLVNVPTVRDVKGNNQVMRVSVDLLRQSVNTLGPSDRETLLSRVAAAERRLKAAPPPAPKEEPNKGKKR